MKLYFATLLGCDFLLRIAILAWAQNLIISILLKDLGVFRHDPLYASPLLLIARFTNKQQAKLIEYLLVENRSLRAKLPKRIEATPAERAKLVKLGKPFGSKLKDIISIVSYRTFLTAAHRFPLERVLRPQAR